MQEKRYKMTFYMADGTAHTGYIVVPQGMTGPQGEKGDPFTYADFTAAQLEALRGPQGRPGADGSPGKNGSDGPPGKDGYTPVKGIDYFDGKDGINGKDGADGKDGTDGHTPVVGIDYFTEADKAEMVSAVIDELPIYNGEVVSV